MDVRVDDLGVDEFDALIKIQVNLLFGNISEEMCPITWTCMFVGYADNSPTPSLQEQNGVFESSFVVKRKSERQQVNAFHLQSTNVIQDELVDQFVCRGADDMFSGSKSPLQQDRLRPLHCL